MSVSVDERRLRELYEAHGPALLGYALRRAASAEDAADVVADTFVVVWRRIADVPDGADARLWLYGVARRVLANQRRASARRDRLGEKLRTFVAALPVADASDAEGEVLAAMRRLSDDDQELLRLTSWEGLTPGEVGVAMDLPAATVRTRLHRARRRLRAELAPNSSALAPDRLFAEESAR